ncbi:MAG TPA: tetratricopeptide repeat protein [Vicinamibacterales bacterium]|nr:tetratricopeptide repeat protein [Vicinamibacterales bacterium]
MSRRTRIAVLAAVLAAAAHGLLAAQAVPRARQLYDRARELDRGGDAAAALSLLWEAAGLAPADGEIQHALGSALERIGALDAAIDAFRAAARAPRSPRGASNSLVLALVKGGRSEEAIAYGRELTASAPADADRWFTLGLAQAEVDVDGAIESFRRALTLDDRHALARYNLGLVFFRTDRFQMAIDELTRALAIQPRPEIYYSLGTIYRHLGDLDRAAQALADAVAANGDYADAHLALGTVYKAKGDLKRAASSLRRAAALRPDLAAPHIVLAQTLALARDEEGARRASAEADRLRALSQRSQEAAALTAAGAQKLDAGDAAGAADIFRRATQAFDAFAPAHYQLGRALQHLGQHDAAKAAFARAQQLNPALVPPR